ncbi:MAG: helix-turn-helix domain-containing protein [Prevotella sp.]|nr:helix-turn-helix domain-containing protein [Prevotella sp.]
MYKHLTLAQRYYIYIERQKGSTVKSIAEAIGANKSTVSRGLRHGKQAVPPAKAAWRLLLPYKGEGLKTITTDNGSEFAAHE